MSSSATTDTQGNGNPADANTSNASQQPSTVYNGTIQEARDAQVARIRLLAETGAASASAATGKTKEELRLLGEANVDYEQSQRDK